MTVPARLTRRALRAAAVVWAGPNSIIGLLLAPLGFLPGGSIRLRDGVLECVVGSLPRFLRAVGDRGGIEAFALGHVVVAGSAALMSKSREHERVHVRQYERYGPFFLPLYVLSSVLALARRDHPYDHNRFERNDITHGGDGVFIRSLNGWVSIGNVFIENDFSRDELREQVEAVHTRLLAMI